LDLVAGGLVAQQRSLASSRQIDSALDLNEKLARTKGGQWCSIERDTGVDRVLVGDGVGHRGLELAFERSVEQTTIQDELRNGADVPSLSSAAELTGIGKVGRHNIIDGIAQPDVVDAIHVGVLVLIVGNVHCALHIDRVEGGKRSCFFSTIEGVRVPERQGGRELQARVIVTVVNLQVQSELCGNSDGGGVLTAGELDSVGTGVVSEGRGRLEGPSLLLGSGRGVR
jgi:hypothetical protein